MSPFHPDCRCTTTVYFKDDDLPNEDNKLYYDITDEYKDVSPGIVKALKEVEIDDKVYSVNGKNFVLD